MNREIMHNLRLLAFATAVLSTTAAVGSEATGADDQKFTQKWHCVDIATTGIRWNSDTETYRDASFFMQQHLIDQTGDQLTLPKTLGFSDSYRCGFRANSPVLTCQDPVHIFNLNVQTGRASHSKTYGWMDPYARPDPMFVSALVCRVQ